MNSTCVRLAIGLLLVAIGSSLAFAQTAIGEGDFKFEIKHRVNAHGDEFNTLAMSSDGQRLFTGTEKGDVLIWNVAANRLERTLHQPSGIHFVVALSDPRELIAAGSNHLNPQTALVRRWNVETGTFADLPGIDSDSFVTGLAANNTAGLIAATEEKGLVVVWEARTNKQLAHWKVHGVPTAVALSGRNVYVATVDQLTPNSAAGAGAIVKLNLDDQKQPPADLARKAGRLWVSLNASPDRRLLAGTYQEGYNEGKIVVINPVSKAELATYEATAAVWLDASRLLIFDWMNPTEIIRLAARTPASSIRKFGNFEADTPGRAFALTGQVSNGAKVWASYSKGPGLLEFDLATRKIKTLIGGPSGAYGVSVNTQDGQTGALLTGGADGYVRWWNLADVSLIKEHKVAKADAFVSAVHLVPSSRQAVIEVRKMPRQHEQPGPSEVVNLDLETGQQQKLFDMLSWRAQVVVIDNTIVYPEGNRIRIRNLDGSEVRELRTNVPIDTTALSANKRWLAAVGETELTVFDLKTDQQQTIQITPVEYGPLVVTNDGRHVYNLGLEGALTHWDLDSGSVTNTVLSRIRDMHSRVDFMTLANDDRWLVTAGNHHDVGFFDRATNRLVFFMQVGGAAFFVENVWTNGKRVIVTTDIGVMYEGVLQ